MNDLDAYYRALKSYRDVIDNNRQCTQFKNALATSNPENDSLTITQNTCVIDEDWINEIEKGLVFIEKAIKENRQFIDSNGEVLPIEKVKHVSKESVSHLAKHSNFITKYNENEDITPDKLYSVEKLNDYAVYENRFLYMLLCYLRDFVTIRANDILSLSNKYDGTLKLDKKITSPKHKFTYHVELRDERSDDAWLKANNPINSAIDRIYSILNSIVSFLNMPLMEVVSKEAMISPPITRTNVLKMDNNFRGAVALYDFILAYDKPGYTITEQRTQVAPFNKDASDEFAQVGALLAFLTYKNSLSLEPVLKGRFDTEEQKRKENEIKERNDELLQLKNRLENMECSPEEYILLLEKQVSAMNEEFWRVDELNQTINQLSQSKNELEARLGNANIEIESVRAELENAIIRHNDEIDELKSEHENYIQGLMLDHEEKLKSAQDDCNKRIDEVKQEMQAVTDKLNQDIANKNESLNESIAKLNLLNEEYQALITERDACKARITALRVLSNEEFSEDDFTDEEGFNELERELEAFVKFYDDRWDIAKSKIRKRLLSFSKLKQNKNKSK